jgi:hypothetical protein
MSDPLTTLRASHPDLTWSEIGPSDFAGKCDLLRVFIASPTPEAPTMGLAIDRPYADGWRCVAEEHHAEMSIDGAAAELVDIRRAIGWPVGVAS